MLSLEIVLIIFPLLFFFKGEDSILAEKNQCFKKCIIKKLKRLPYYCLDKVLLVLWGGPWRGVALCLEKKADGCVDNSKMVFTAGQQDI